MDAKLKRISILCCASVILLMALIVLLMNREEAPYRENPPAVSMPPKETQSAESPSNQIGQNLQGFLQDETFFDPQNNDFLQDKLEEKKRLSMIVTSVEKDLRIQIVDGGGNLVTGEEFSVELGDQGTFTDSDKDGLIYVDELSSGEYSVTLKKKKGYHMPSFPIRARVKEKVEYYPISDITILMKTEEEVVAENEDTMEWTSAEDEDETQIRTAILDKKNALNGIDVSKWNGLIDWEEVGRSDISFAIIRAGYRGSKTGSLVIDPCFEDNMKGAGQAGLYRGVYFFTQAVNEVEAVEEASMVIELLRPYKIQFPVFIDTEGAGENARANGLDRETRTAVCEAFCRTIQNAGYEAGVYASRSWYQHQVKAERLEKYHIWLAEYRNIPLYEGYYEMWQHTSKGSVPGILGNVDRNLSYWKPQQDTDDPGN